MGDEDFGFDDFGADEGEDFGFDGFDEDDEAAPAEAAAAEPAVADPPATENAASSDASPSKPAPKVIDDDSTAKAKVPCPLELEERRSWDSCTFKWAKLDQTVTKLQLQAMPANKKNAFADGFDRKAGGKGLMIADPNSTTEATIPKLDYEVSYQFRLVALNKHGKSEGPNTESIATLVYSPDRGDKSGWLIKRPNLRGRAGTLRGTRRLSLKKQKPERYFFVLDGALLSWYSQVDAPQEVGFLHINKVKEMSYINEEGTTRLCLHLNDKDETTYELDFPEDPRVGAAETSFKSWLKCLTDARVRSAGLEKATVKTIASER
eukprot:m.14678 g.14678  ORF g.14678 m.14678 type:complete len:321 (+) comp4872_c1_seq1:214-1176(+)